MGNLRDLSRFDAQFFGVHTRQAHTLDPQQRLLMERAYEAIFDAGYDPSEFRGQKVGVFVGSCVSESGWICSCDTDKIAAFGLLGSSMGMLSNRVSYAMDFIGPSVTVDTACSSTMVALNQAVLAIRSGQCEAAVVGGSSLVLLPTSSLGFALMQVLSPDGKCRVFDANLATPRSALVVRRRGGGW
ncbi:hypothetical protein HPB48_018773 [Haemaphysalis longicornis]|uniref:Ketosynthase family 3 (KS3) domain-containing protein n=1 Tax=Haemaphysalis longicornis TaxID=44386 RepID=A0A9J6GM27_HAELO|nr:hypothetical protein HPB48_018773 [Haemaphysalis longicornis]